MPITKSAKKALRQSIKRHQKNLQKKEAIKDIVKKIKKLVSQGKTEEAKVLLPQAYKTIDKASKSYLHKRAAARKKSRLTALLNKSSIQA
ncbi:MAG: small subunit ribosomal protein S20 [Parcubacteria group bacterium Gr01-1014_2]|nr:MAG: small subunit ribosomal protein S20 [Parcubacteria group bacterium Gr01-1014_2]